jgi:hypothetical protein
MRNTSPIFESRAALRECIAKHSTPREKKLCAHAHHFRFNDLRGVPSRAKETPPAQERGRRKNQARNRLRDTACA